MSSDTVATRLAAHGLLELAEEVAARHHLTLDELLGRSRHQPESVARRELWARVYAVLPSFTRVGLIFDRDHTSILLAVRKYRAESPATCNRTGDRRFVAEGLARCRDTDEVPHACTTAPLARVRRSAHEGRAA